MIHSCGFRRSIEKCLSKIQLVLVNDDVLSRPFLPRFRSRRLLSSDSSFHENAPICINRRIDLYDLSVKQHNEFLARCGRARSLQAEAEHAAAALEAAGVKVSSDFAVTDMPAAQESVLALALREGVTNVIRHAKASSCRLSLRVAPEGLSDGNRRRWLRPTCAGRLWAFRQASTRRSVGRQAAPRNFLRNAAPHHASGGSR